MVQTRLVRLTPRFLSPLHFPWDNPRTKKRRYSVTYESLNWFSSCPGRASGKAD